MNVFEAHIDSNVKKLFQNYSESVKKLKDKKAKEVEEIYRENIGKYLELYGKVAEKLKESQKKDGNVSYEKLKEAFSDLVKETFLYIDAHYSTSIVSKPIDSDVFLKKLFSYLAGIGGTFSAFYFLLPPPTREFAAIELALSVVTYKKVKNWVKRSYRGYKLKRARKKFEKLLKESSGYANLE